MLKVLCLILCKSKSVYVQELKNTLVYAKIDCDIVEDDPLIEPQYNGLAHLKKISKFKYSSTSWDNSFKQIFNKHIENYNFFYFIEDDVYSKNLNSFVDAINYFKNDKSDLISSNILSKQKSSFWDWWKKDLNYKIFKNPHKSFNPFCRLSKELIKKILLLHQKYKKFFYHEFLFASLAKDHQMIITDFENTNCPYIGKIVWRPIIKKEHITNNKIYHPIKNK